MPHHWDWSRYSHLGAEHGIPTLGAENGMHIWGLNISASWGWTWHPHLVGWAWNPHLGAEHGIPTWGPNIAPPSLELNMASPCVWWCFILCLNNGKGRPVDTSIVVGILFPCYLLQLWSDKLETSAIFRYVNETCQARWNVEYGQVWQNQTPW